LATLKGVGGLVMEEAKAIGSLNHQSAPVGTVKNQHESIIQYQQIL
jgi:hypothetical protein